MRKYYLIRARLLDANGSEKRLIWKLKQVWFWNSPVNVIKAYMEEAAAAYPQLGFDLIEFKEV